MNVRGIRGAITVKENTAQQIEDATYEMMNEIINLNSINENDVISIIFTATKDLNQQYPSTIIRSHFNWRDTPILNFEEKDVVNSLEKCIRVLIYIHTDKEKKDMVHVYLREAKNLRPDLCLK
ncbi:chorismate mutase [Alkaliphilus sp. B6464]|uniref:chorismate mutase n=1 Tax=Alkaliphilus sp. B6464 TaxID=2731219 RepID=UPI001BAE3624|nr:chorismate mutase [Alkaliphilus sp. B6464]QUH20747.1 chorismate mutase [Alkaliphilus sp. B6464]